MSRVIFNINYISGLNLYKKGLFEDAKIKYRKALFHNINHAQCTFKLGMCYFKLQQWKKAKLYIEKAISMDPSKIGWDKQLEQSKKHLGISKQKIISEDNKVLQNDGFYLQKSKEIDLGSKDNYSIDIIVPAYNAESTIEKCLNSLLAQKYNNLRVIVVDDGSTDNTNKIINEIINRTNGKIHLITQENSGVSVARNNALKLSEADFIGFVDSDDYVSEDIYIELLKSADDKTDIIICGRYDVDKNGKKEILPNRIHNNTNLAINKEILSGVSLFVWDKIFRRDMLVKYNINFPIDLKYAEDAVFLSKVFYHSRNLKVVDVAFYFYNIAREDSVTSSCNSSWLDIPLSLKMINEYYLNQGVFFTYWTQLEKLAYGYFRRRMGSIHLYSNKRMQLKYIKEHIIFMEQYFPGWKKLVAKDKKLIYTNQFMRTMYILIPNFIKKYKLNLEKYMKRFKNKIILYKYFWKYIPISKSTALFISYSGDSISDNLLYLSKENNKYKKLYFATRKISRDSIFSNHNRLNIILVDVRSIKYIWLLATSSLIITNSRVPTYFNKREKQTLINTWHGTPIKTLGASMQSGIKDIGRNQNQFLMSDCLLFPNKFTKEVMYTDFFLNKLYQGNNLLQGYPRNDPFLYSNQQKNKLRNKLGVANKNIIVYMPTWRGTSIGDVNQEAYLKYLMKMLYKIDASLGYNSILYVKLHQSVGMYINDARFKNIRKAPESYDIYEILSISDLLISDYSSIMFDYLYTKKPIILFLYDYDEYKKDRGFYFDVSETPFYKAYGVEDLIYFLNSKLTDYDYKEYYSKFCLTPKNTFSKDFWKSIDEIGKYKKEESLEYEVYFFDSINNDILVEEILELSKKDNIIISLHHSDIDSSTEKFIFDNKDKLIFVIAPSEMLQTFGEKLILFIFIKFSILKFLARKIYQYELRRTFGEIKISKIYNRSKRKKFINIVKSFKSNR